MGFDLDLFQAPSSYDYPLARGRHQDRPTTGVSTAAELGARLAARTAPPIRPGAAPARSIAATDCSHLITLFCRASIAERF